MEEKSNLNSLDKRTFNKLSRLYIIALSAIALSVIISQILIRTYLNDQQSDSSVINVAGRQRMLSQKLTKELLLLGNTQNPDKRSGIGKNLDQTIQLWSASHRALQEGDEKLDLPGENSQTVSEMFKELNPLFDDIYNSSLKISRSIKKNSSVPYDSLKYEIENVLSKEPSFLKLMDSIVNQYDVEANQKVNRLRNLELIILIISLLILISEFFFIFLPAALAVKDTISRLLTAEKRAKKMAIDADELSEEKERSVKELRMLSYAMDQTLLFARVKQDGTIIHMGDKFSKLFGYQEFNTNAKFSEVVTKVNSEKKYLNNLISDNYNKGWQGEIRITTKNNVPLWLETTMIPVSITENKTELLIICFDITTRKEAQLEIDRLTKESFEEKMNRQKVISSKIIENQENEQNRIAKDIHDGIGQMLTGLKFNLESIDLRDKEKSTLKIEQLKNLTSEIIKGVRTATFNLTPPELSDHGIVPALAKMAHELSRLTGKNIVFINKTGFNERLDSLVEINTYRITQEAVNNAIKYADSTHIIITLSHSKNLLGITVDDNGKGFELSKLSNKKNITGGGMGMTYMKERISYINGRLFMNSKPGEGTRITLNIPF
ncbi:sensor histidine kinase [Abyssalbus ytuae]|uniref:Oxygen sensor histidine kinase NreB n=1 Tax=Abyssalbus ytuae TaxID=2926907 RepID=A0A9E7A1N4_9FLAO|nr:type IV pili methyl-accepting chemotaxis transducer N-terminal domain-containing protein [Abyssalbus ytuae]UOB18081.1 type IV pili methyl-accepting chemotaxis transducer N-terminal domain-containing protein [Abyssalbus ytuae]